MSLWLATAALLGVYAGLRWLVPRLPGRHRPLVVTCTHPLLLGTLLLAIGLRRLHVDAASWQQASLPVRFWLGPSVVALAVTLDRGLTRSPRELAKLGAVHAALAVTAPALPVLLARAAGGSDALLRSMFGIFTTTPIALAITDTTGGRPGVTAAGVMVVGFLGVLFGPPLARPLRLDERSFGLAQGAASHGLGTMTALGVSELAGAASALSFVLQGSLVPFAVPWLLRLLLG